jgi:hypothetical protein
MICVQCKGGPGRFVKGADLASNLAGEGIDLASNLTSCRSIGNNKNNNSNNGSSGNGGLRGMGQGRVATPQLTPPPSPPLPGLRFGVGT